MSSVDNNQLDWRLQPPGIWEVRSARHEVLVRTPLLESTRVNRLLGGRLLLKAEGLQQTGSFKARGAFNFISGVPDLERGVIAYSSGNHAQAVAWAASHFGARALVLMPRTAPTVKVRRTRDWGAEVRQIDWGATDARAYCEELAAQLAMIMVPPFEDRRIIAGAATLGVEIVEQAEAMGAGPLDAVLAGCSGGGLLAGTALAFHALSPQTEVWGVEPENFDDLTRSLESGTRVANSPGFHTICDALSARTTGQLTFSIVKAHAKGALSVSEREVLDAMRLAFDEFKLVIEPGGAAALAAVLSGHFRLDGRTVGIVASGANVDAELFKTALG